MKEDMQRIISFAKRRGFIYPSSEIYGGLANAYDYGPLGVELMANIKELWWKTFVRSKPDIVGLDTSILMSPRVWEASGHTKSFADVMVDCRECQLRTRADHVIEDYLSSVKKEEKVEGKSTQELSEMISSHKIPCPNCGKHNWTEARMFNQLFETRIGILPESQSLAYLRGEIAQGMFVNFKNVTDSFRVINPNLEYGLPFGIAQSGKAFRNEITKGQLTFRTLEFNLAEIEYFFNPQVTDWRELFAFWKREIEHWTHDILKISQDHVQWRPQAEDERAHYSTHTEDMDYGFPFGMKETYALAYRTDYDLKNHMEKSGQDLRFEDPKTGEKIIPHVLEPTFGLDRTLLALLSEHYEEGERNILHLPFGLAPFKVAVFPLMGNKPELIEKAREIFGQLSPFMSVAWDARGNVGKRYYAQDEIGTPLCVTVDYTTLEDGTVTVRNRDTAEQVRVRATDLRQTIDHMSLSL